MKNFSYQSDPLAAAAKTILEASATDLNKYLDAVKKAGFDVKGTAINLGSDGSGHDILIKVSIEDGRLKLDGGLHTGVVYYDRVEDAIQILGGKDLAGNPLVTETVDLEAEYHKLLQTSKRWDVDFKAFVKKHKLLPLMSSNPLRRGDLKLGVRNELNGKKVFYGLDDEGELIKVFGTSSQPKIVYIKVKGLEGKPMTEGLQPGILAKALALGALASASVFGNFAQDWSKYYQGTSNPEKTARAEKVLQAGYKVPAAAAASIDVASSIFAGDRGHSKKQIADYLEKTGAVETGYSTKVQLGGGPARSYWQVEPATAMSLVKNSSKFFGPKFKSKFGEKNFESMKSWGEKEWSKALETNSDLAATMAAAKWISTSW